MPDTLGVRIQGLDEAVKKLGPELTARPMGRFFERSATAVETDAKRNAPVDRGRLRSSIAHEVDKGKPPLWARVGTNLEYAPYMEFGTGIFAEGDGGKGGAHYPPYKELVPWVRRKGIAGTYSITTRRRLGGKHTQARQDIGAAIAIAKAIGKRGGLKPRRFLRNALKDNLNKIKGFLRQAGAEMEQRWGRAR